MKRRWLFTSLSFLACAFTGLTCRAQEIRAAYCFPSGRAWTASVELPRYDLLDIGPVGVPIGVNDSGELLLRDPANRLVRWSWGRLDVLWEPFSLAQQAFINGNGTVVASDYQLMEKRLLYWFRHDTSPSILDVANHLVGLPNLLQIYGLNDADTVVFRADASENLFFVPDIRQLETNLVGLSHGGWQELTRYTYHLNIDFSTTYGGRVYEVYGINNYGDTVGLVSEGGGSSQPGDPNPDDQAYDNEYYSLNVTHALDFEPMAISDSGSILGVTRSPMAGLVVLDPFGQRYIGPMLGELATRSPAMSNPVDGLEEIVIGSHYFKRKSECDLSGNPTGAPSPEFHYGALGEILTSGASMNSMAATCISSNGRIAGTGWVWDPVAGMSREHAFVLVDPLLVPDWDRNGKIDTFDRKFSRRGESWHFWINDDDDTGDLAESSDNDLPGSLSPDCDNTMVDGLRDIVDFFPVLVDVHKILKSVESVSDISIRIRQADAAINFIETQLSPLEVGNIHRQPYSTGFGSGFTEALETATTRTVGPDGILLTNEFLAGILQQGSGVLLFEASRATTEPLVMEFINRGNVVVTSTLPLSTSPVRSMMRILNLRDADPKFNASTGPWQTSLADPPNLPDRFLEAMGSPVRTLLHIHGFNWTGEEIPAAHSEVFKRFFQSGSPARFIGISWHGDYGTLDLTGSSFEYNENVIHAFLSAKYLAEQIQPFAGKYTSIFAHSLGNMVASSAITDFSLPVGNYFMTNAAVAVEAYAGEAADRRHMVHPDWKDEGYVGNDYAGHLISPNWHRLFGPDDNRSFLKWKDRFAALNHATHCLNFYSSGEDVLRTGNGDLPSLFGDVVNNEWVWVFNELVKGTNTFAANLSSDVHGGWGFNRYWMDWVDPGGPAHPPAGSWVEVSPAEADLIDPVELVSEPFFRNFHESDNDFPAWGDSSWLGGSALEANAHLPMLPLGGSDIDTIKNHAKIIAEAIPAHSAPTGSQPIASFPLLNNIDLDSVVRDPVFWPARESSSQRNRWLHSDYMKPALPHVWKFFNLCVKEINQLP